MADTDSRALLDVCPCSPRRGLSCLYRSLRPRRWGPLHRGPPTSHDLPAYAVWRIDSIAGQEEAVQRCFSLPMQRD